MGTETVVTSIVSLARKVGTIYQEIYDNNSSGHFLFNISDKFNTKTGVDGYYPLPSNQ